MRRVVLALVALGACGAAQAPRRPTDGAIGGITRDRDTGEAVGFASLTLLRGSAAIATTHATRQGHYGFDHLAPGRYAIDADTIGARTHVANIGVVAGVATIADVELARGSAAVYDINDAAAIEHFTPPGHAATGEIVGVIGDAATHAPIDGAVVTLIGGDNTLQAVSDAAGRYRFAELPPGTYSVSAYYGVEGHAQIELRRSDIAVTAGGGVRVPLFIETAR